MSEPKRVIYKYRVEPEGITIPAGAVVHVGTQKEAYTVGVYVWVQHDLNEDGDINEPVDMQLKAVGTGQPYDGNSAWIPVGSVQIELDFPLVLHILRKILWPEES